MRPRVTRVATLAGYCNYREVLQIPVPDFVTLLCYPAKVVKVEYGFLTCIAFYLSLLYKFFILSLFFLFSYFLIRFYFDFLLFILQFRFIPFISPFHYKSPCNLPTKNKSVSGLHFAHSTRLRLRESICYPRDCSWRLVFVSPVRSGLLAQNWRTETGTGPPLS